MASVCLSYRRDSLESEELFLAEVLGFGALLMNWAVLSTVMVAVHLVTEYAHYIIEFCWGKKDKDILKDILQHRKSSRKSEMLVEIVKDLRRIKKHLGIEEEEENDKD